MHSGFGTDSSWMIAAGVLQYYMEEGCWYPRGGGAQIAQHLVATLLANDGQVLVKANVEEILVDRPSNRVYGELPSSSNK